MKNKNFSADITEEDTFSSKILTSIPSLSLNEQNDISSVYTMLSDAIRRELSSAMEELQKNEEKWSQIINYFADEQSQFLYKKELVFCVLQQILCTDKMILYSPFSLEHWNKAIQATLLASEQKALPQIEGMSLENSHHLCTMTSCYLLEQYAYMELVKPQQGDVVLDCGACFGETALWFRMNEADTVYSFEPDPDSYALLEKNAHNYDPSKKWFIPVPLALGKEEGFLAFMQNKDHPGSSSFHEKGALQVPVTTLDRWCEQNQVQPDFIKMDLEGTEIEALKGAMNTFRKYKPRFAICLYHSFSHMWEIPLLLKQYVPEYQFWCKKSSLIGECILFGKVDTTL